MKYTKVEVSLKTNKSKEYLWNKINTISKIKKFEGFKGKPKKINKTTYELKWKNQPVLITFIPEKAVNMIFVGSRTYPMSWFEINSKIVKHGVHMKTDTMSKITLKKEINYLKKHFLEELQGIAK